ncbi:hypothetical protein BT63DRAFT_458005 [Microthyrium microscopicum]|uniref:Ribosome assembly protein 3 n=1 Tax=Microthyrium microscopicum TaxID=703497 RepID=A0A6A6U456_9PEZI|nr:hypothetical protein BT63DRAFT_458005 [Microthyrium microscopicum]
MTKDKNKKQKKQKQDHKATEKDAIPAGQEDMHHEPKAELKLQDSHPDQSRNSDFDAFYLRKVTMELQEDLDKIRSAVDFKDSSLPILISALQQGSSLFSEAEKSRIMGEEASVHTK